MLKVGEVLTMIEGVGVQGIGAASSRYIVVAPSIPLTRCLSASKSSSWTSTMQSAATTTSALITKLMLLAQRM